MFELSVTGDIASAHFLPGYDGPCKDLHGHTWKIEVVLASERLDAIGFVVDFREIKKKLRDFLAHIDHVCLNDIAYFKTVNPTTENIAKYVFQHFQKEIQPLKLKEVRVWESESSSVRYFE